MSEQQNVESQAIEARVKNYLDDHGVGYDVIEIDPEFADTAQFCQRYSYGLEQSVNCILVASKGDHKQYSACLVQATRRLDVNHTVRALMGVRRLSFASADETVALTGMTPGGVTPFCLPAGVPIYIDAPVASLGQVVLGGGGRSTKILMEASALVGLPAARVIDGLAGP